MSNIDDKIEEYKKMLTDLEKQKKDEEEASRETIDWNMEQLNKYVIQYNMNFNNKIIRYPFLEFVYKILKDLFTSNKKLSNDYDNVISRLDNLENENKYLKEKLYDLI
jgi:hypothetical protein